MVGKSKSDRLFGAACVYVTLEFRGLSPDLNELYLATIADLDVSPQEVEEYLAAERERVEAALARRGAAGNASR